MTTEAKLRARLVREVTRLQSERLPGWNDYAAGDPKVQPYLDQLCLQVENSIRDEDTSRFDKELDSVILAWERVNERLAEVYRTTHLDPELWELRYVKWMNIRYIQFSSPLGELYLIPRMSSRKPLGVNWCTVDEMLTWLNPTVAAVIKMSGSWPPRDPTFKPPGLGEQVIRIDATGAAVKTTFEIGKARRYG